AYLANTLGGAVGVLLGGFVFVGAFGLPGTLAAAASLNLLAACGVLVATGGRWELANTDAVVDPGVVPDEGDGEIPRPLFVGLLGVAFGTAVASFAYEIGWIRMLALLLGSASHAFEIMLSAFILGLAGGAYLIRRRADAHARPLVLLGRVQWLMGAAALATLPVYMQGFDVVAVLVDALHDREGGYAAFNLMRYGLAAVVMLPATILAGMTLPLITGTLMRRGAGEEAIGRVYAVNTLGSVLGAAAAGLVLLPLLGLRGLIVAGAALDMGLGVWVLRMAVTPADASSRRAPWGFAAASVGLCAFMVSAVHLDPVVLTSGAFRLGEMPRGEEREMLFYRDGRTSTVSVQLDPNSGVVVLATNGKPDASLGPRWFVPGRDTVLSRPISARRDETTQLLLPLFGLAYRPDARKVANIGHGSGMTGHLFLASPVLERMVTIEIEPAMVEASTAFLPANQRVFDDERSYFVLDDARSYFSYRDERFDLIFSEPSNPWVSGVSSLFTREFYRTAGRYLADDGIFVQWIHLYEITDDLVLTVLAAMAEEFPYIEGYLVGDADMVLVAGRGGPLRAPDWSVLRWPGVEETLAGIPPFLPRHMESLRLLDRAALDPLLRGGTRVNSDFHPYLDLGAEGARFQRSFAEGIYSLAANRVDLIRTRRHELLLPPDTALPVPAVGLEPILHLALASWLRSALAAGGGIPPEEFPEWMEAMAGMRDYLLFLQLEELPGDWMTFMQSFDEVERNLHWGTAGWVDEPFYEATYRYLDAVDAPPEVRAGVDLMYGIGKWDFPRAAAAADILVGRVAMGTPWVRPTVLLDAAVLAYLETGRPDDAARALQQLRGPAGRPPDNLRMRLIDAWIEEAR
ncbi:MAG: hypothetical protein OEZ37_11730, partial [Gemmatimonadota bacterium]|nr:hypothetical protein [Gemmatimonadota bacterium]